jgi:hypothetical protein
MGTYVKRTPISDSSPSLQLQFQKRRHLQPQPTICGCLYNKRQKNSNFQQQPIPPVGVPKAQTLTTPAHHLRPRVQKTSKELQFPTTAHPSSCSSKSTDNQTRTMCGVSFSFWKATEHHPHQQSQQSTRLVGLLFVFILACLFLIHVFCSVGGGGSGRAVL